MSAPQTYDAGVSHQIGRYSDAIQVPAGYDQIIVSGTPGIDENGNIPAETAGVMAAVNGQANGGRDQVDDQGELPTNETHQEASSTSDPDRSA